MKQGIIKYFLERGSLRKRSADINRTRSLIESAETISKATLKIQLNEDNATIIFRELYEAIRQLGDAKLWKLGYESRQHEPSMEILMAANIKNKIELNRLDRFRMIRNDANYRGYKVTIIQAKEIIEFWKNHGKELIKWIKNN